MHMSDYKDMNNNAPQLQKTVVHILNLFYSGMRVLGQVCCWQFHAEVQYRNPDTTINELDSFAPHSTLMQRTLTAETEKLH